MSDQEKQGWRDWFKLNPEWIRPIGKSINKRPFLVVSSKYFHDMANLLVPIYAVYKQGGK